jgi:hypothetical protein
MLAAKGTTIPASVMDFFHNDGGRLSKVFIGHPSTIRMDVLPLCCPHTVRLD